MAIRTRSYTQYLQHICGLLGIPTGRLSTEIAEGLRVAFNAGLEQVWDYWPWQDVCPYGEARFVGNVLTYPNDLSQTANWTATALTITGKSLKNPLDGRVTASKCLETAATSAHSVAQASLPILVATNYTLSAYVRPNGRDHFYFKFNDGVTNYTAFYNVTTGVVGTVAGTGAAGSMQNVGSGYYLCTLTFKTDAAATATGTLTLQVSTDGSTLSYAGDTAKGLYIWGVLLQQTTNTGVSDSLVAFDQTGETRMETVFQVWKDSPFNARLPRPLGYELTPDGIQIVSGNVISYATVNAAGVTVATPQSNPVFVFYRKDMPTWEGSDYSESSTYAVNDQVLFTNSASVQDYYKCIVATTAGQDPDDTPTSWEKLEIPDSMFSAAVWFAYSDWLVSDGQQEKAAGALANAERKLLDACERESRQSARDGIPLRVATHTTSQFRAAG